MSRLALYQKYRSQTFDEVVGQEYVVRSIKNALKENKVGHAYLFCGPRGTGKTTMARLLARAVNCENPAEAPCGHCANCKAAIEGTHPDIIEINAANETHVEDIRDLIERSRLAPMMGKHKVYIIDEVHQLSTSAASALLKTLEEPPEHVIFILATTDPQKLINTIISRCQRFDFSKVDTTLIKDHLLLIASKENFHLDQNAAEKIAELSDGGMRDALSILEQAASYSADNITEESIDEIYGLASAEEKIGLLDDIFAKNLAGVLDRITNSEQHGIDLKRLTADLISALKDGVIWNYTSDASLLHVLTEQQACHVSEGHSSRELLDMIRTLMDAQNQYRNAQSTAQVFEIACMELMTPSEAVIRTSEPAEEKPYVPEKKKEPEPVSFHASMKTEPADTIPSINPAEEKPEPVLKTDSGKKIELLDLDHLTAFLVSCTKADKKADDEILKKLTGGIQMNRYIGVLRQCDLGASGADRILFICRTQAVVNQISEADFNRGFYEYLKSNGIDKMPFAASADLYAEVRSHYASLMKGKALPEAMVVHRYEEPEKKVEKELTPEEKTLKLFGAENVEIIEGDK